MDAYSIEIAARWKLDDARRDAELRQLHPRSPERGRGAPVLDAAADPPPPTPPGAPGGGRLTMVLPHPFAAVAIGVRAEPARVAAPDSLIIDRMAVRVSSPVLVGRATELDRLLELVAGLRSGASRSVVVAGEAGVGKTRLVSEFAERARDEVCIVLAGGCVELGDGALPYAPVVEALRGLVRRGDIDDVDAILGPARPELARLIPDLGPVADGQESGLGIGSAQGRLFELVLGVLERLAGRAPVVLVAEDLHWSDQSTRDLLGFLVRNLHDVPVALVLTYRSDELHRRHPLLPFVAELGRSGLVERVELSPFDLGDAAAQLRAIAGDDLDLRLIESIHARSGGNAFFAEELLMTSEDAIDSDLPPTLRDVLLARIAGLGEPTQEFLRIASAAGQRVDPSLLAAAAGLDEAALYEALRECVGRQVLVPDPSGGTERYAFRHALLQEAVYDDLLPGERTRLHSAFARTLEARSGGDAVYAAELSYHWFAAHDLGRALETSVAAGMAAESRYAFPEAVGHYERAIDLWDQVPDAEQRIGRDRVSLLATLAGVARYHDAARAVTHIRAAIALVEADPGADPIERGLLYERLGRYAWVAGQGQLANDAYRMAVDGIPAEPPSAARARAVAGLAQIRMLGARFAEALVLAEEALAVARASGAREIEGHALNTRGHSRAIEGDVDGGLADLDASLAIAEELGVVDDIGRAYANKAWILETAGRLEAAIEMASVGVATVERLGLLRFFGTHMLCGEADYQYRLGNWEQSERLIRRAEDVEPIGINAILVPEMAARLAMVRGRFDEAAQRLAPLAPLAARATDIQFICPVETSLAELALWEGRPDDALQRLLAAIPLIDFSPEVRLGEMYGLGIRAAADEAELARGRRTPDAEAEAVAAGDALLEELRARHAIVLAERPVFAWLSEAWLRWCEAEATRLHRTASPEAWASAVTAWEPVAHPAVIGYLRWREAEAHLAARGDRAAATVALQTAWSIADKLGAVPLKGEIDALAARARLEVGAGADPSEAETSGASVATPAATDADGATRLGLTAREREVLELVALGRTNRQIADELFISTNTAGVHVSNILGKLDVTSRGEAAAHGLSPGARGGRSRGLTWACRRPDGAGPDQRDDRCRIKVEAAPEGAASMLSR